MLDKIKQEKISFKESIKIRDAVLRLEKNKDFQLIIEKVFMVDECARNARVSGSFTLSEESRADALSKAQAAGHLAEFLVSRVQLGNLAEKSLQDLEESELELINETNKE